MQKSLRAHLAKARASAFTLGCLLSVAPSLLTDDQCPAARRQDAFTRDDGMAPHLSLGFVCGASQRPLFLCLSILDCRSVQETERVQEALKKKKKKKLVLKPPKIRLSKKPRTPKQARRSFTTGVVLIGR